MASYSEQPAPTSKLRLAIDNLGLAQSDGTDADVSEHGVSYVSAIKATDMQGSDKFSAGAEDALVTWAVDRLKAAVSEGAKEIHWRKRPMIAVYENNRKWCLRVVMRYHTLPVPGERKPKKAASKAKKSAAVPDEAVA